MFVLQQDNNGCFKAGALFKLITVFLRPYSF